MKLYITSDWHFEVSEFRDPVPFYGPPEGGVSGLFHGSWLVTPPGFCNEIGGLWPIAP